jgi:ABC-type uncharacterized transport system substrate-binding protein
MASSPVSIDRGNLTGVSLFNVALAEKQVEVLHQAFPDRRHIAALINPRNVNSERFVRGAEAAARTLGLELIVVNAERDRELDNAFSTFVQRSVRALVVLGDPFFNARRKQLVARRLATRYPRCTSCERLSKLAD